MEGGDDGVRLARSPMNEPPLPADEDDSDTDSDDRNEAVVEETVPSTNKSSEATLVTDKTAPVSTVVPGTDLDSQESLSVLLTSVRGRPCSICDKEQLPALLISGLHGCGASRSEVPDKASLASDVAASVATVDSASASDTTKPGSPALLESSSVDIALQQESQVGKASEGLDEPSATICLEKPNAGGSPQQWPGIDRDSLHHISDMNLRPPRSRRTRKSSKDTVTFDMHSAIRSAGSPATDHSWDCPDEEPGCPMTKWFLCAVDGWNTTTRTQDQRVGFLTCWDDATGTSESKTRECAKSVSLDMDEITACHSGIKAESLQLAAAKYFEQRFPSHAHSGIFDVPHVFVDGKDLGYQADYQTILKTLCATGIEAAACK